MRRVVTVMVTWGALVCAAGVPEAGAAQERAPAGFVALADVAPGVLQEIRYAGPHNFVGERVDGYREGTCLLARETALALREVHRAAQRHGYGLKTYDCYRPQRAVDHFVRWALERSDVRMKAEFYPRVAKDRLFSEGYIARRSGHSSGGTVDVTLVPRWVPGTRSYVPGEPLVPCFAPRTVRFPDASVDMGTGYDCFDAKARTLHPGVTGAQRANRLLLKRLMEAEGFANLPQEWWHFTHRDQPFPHRRFDFPVTRDAVGGPG
ncbi:MULTISPECIES: M15 family metallopeptidase [unclassified Streptomyces]|uniref:M15 family metallopeptidase n=1 Tax=unclassified Streptomyces TaxID=2593676 RepID=UPI0022B6AE2F|nr:MULTISPECIES: M15 family metallopeptidase [unclassified Streptomyces]MCZ7415562.1 M15 family metallopeptidase [Streptomyces sp. WMMC897]MCZ7434626.1 M15 family metallopeptidase [Streptomyces sp. WMMC1477]